jgi:hypothetical protein
MVQKYMIKKLETEVIPANIFCDLHQQDYVFYYNKKEHKLECRKCATSPVHTVRADKAIIDKTSMKLLEMIEFKNGKSELRVPSKDSAD